MENIDNNEEFLKGLLEKQYDEANIKKIFKGYTESRPVTLRINTIKTSVEEIKNNLREKEIEFIGVPWSSTALIIKNRTENDIQKLEIYQDGKIYLQSLSSMLPPIIMEPHPGEDILDMTAAPGGKTTQIAALTENLAHITACELNAIRVERLKYNIQKQGATSSVYVMQKDSREIDDFFSFDKILLDAPCSGSGTLNLDDKNTFKFFSQKLVKKSTKAQSALLKKALKILKPGKEMIYSTCSILACENEEIINEVTKSEKIEIVPINYEWIKELPLLPTKIDGTLCVCPNEFYEGFFIAKIKKVK